MAGLPLRRPCGEGAVAQALRRADQLDAPGTTVRPSVLQPNVSRCLAPLVASRANLTLIAMRTFVVLEHCGRSSVRGRGLLIAVWNLAGHR